MAKKTETKPKAKEIVIGEASEAVAPVMGNVQEESVVESEQAEDTQTMVARVAAVEVEKFKKELQAKMDAELEKLSATYGVKPESDSADLGKQIVEGVVEANKRTELNLDKYPKRSFLLDQIVDVIPVTGKARWDGISKNPSDIPYILKGTKVSFDLPNVLSEGGRLRRVLDIHKKVITPQFPNTPLTELEFYSKLIGVDLSYDAVKNNYWRNPVTGKVVLTIDGDTLDLNNPVDMLKYKILLANTRFVAASKEDWKRYNKSTYEFYIAAKGAADQEDADKADFEAEVYQRYTEVVLSEFTMKEYLLASGESFSSVTPVKTLKAMIARVVKHNPKVFLAIVNDPSYKTKALIERGVQIGLFEKVLTRYTLISTGRTFPDIDGAVSYFSNPLNDSVIKELRYKIDEANKAEKR